MAIGSFIKAPSETYVIGVDYTTAAPDGAILQSGVWQVFDELTAEDVTSTVLLAPGAVIDGQVAKCRVQAGENNHKYELSVVATFNTADVLRDEIIMLVRQDG